ncbi:MAG: hypothetical protein WC692_00645 [Erythrobacter sp.]|jgi:hypothetical protein
MGGPHDQVDKESQRDFLRVDVGVVGHLETLDGRKRVEIVDLSQGGAHVALMDGDGEAEYVVRDCVLRWMTFEAFGEVKWRDGDHFGIAFDEPLRPGVIKETRQQASMNIRNDHHEIKQAAYLWAHGIHPR